MLIKKSADFRYSEITPKSVYLNRRKFLAGAPAALLAGRELLSPSGRAIGATKLTNVVKSPLSGARAAILRIEVFEADASLGEIVLGDVTTFRDQDGTELLIVARRLRFRFASALPAPVPVAKVPPELVPLLRREPGDVALSYREHTLREGDAVRIQAIVAPSHDVVAQGYRSIPRRGFVDRSDLAPVFIEVP